MHSLLKILSTRRLPILTYTIIVFSSAVAIAQTPSSTVLDPFKNGAAAWTRTLFGYAQTLFGLLAAIEIAWTAIILTLEKHDLQAWVASYVKKIMWLGIFYFILTQGDTITGAIIHSFEAAGQQASGAGALAPDSVMGHGFEIMMELLSSAKDKGFLGQPLTITSVLLTLTALTVMVSYLFITIQFVVAKVESYIVISAGVIFLGFGGSRWTVAYVERYIGLAIATGIRLLCLYVIIGLGDQLATIWTGQAATIASLDFADTVSTVFSIACGSVIYAAVCWTVPKIVSSLIGGSPNLTGGDVVATAATLGAAAAGTAALGVGAVATIANGGTAAAGGAAGAGGAMSASQAAGLGTAGTSQMSASFATSASVGASQAPTVAGAFSSSQGPSMTAASATSGASHPSYVSPPPSTSQPTSSGPGSSPTQGQAQPVTQSPQQTSQGTRSTSSP